VVFGLERPELSRLGLGVVEVELFVDGWEVGGGEEAVAVFIFLAFVLTQISP
jgi:hypothetical protein